MPNNEDTLLNTTLSRIIVSTKAQGHRSSKGVSNGLRWQTTQTKHKCYSMPNSTPWSPRPLSSPNVPDPAETEVPLAHPLLVVYPRLFPQPLLQQTMILMNSSIFLVWWNVPVESSQNPQPGFWLSGGGEKRFRVTAQLTKGIHLLPQTAGADPFQTLGQYMSGRRSGIQAHRMPLGARPPGWDTSPPITP